VTHRKRRRRAQNLRFTLFSTLAVLLAGCGGSTTPSAQGGIGQVIPDGPSPTSASVTNTNADMGFRPDQNGFSFANYGNDVMPQNLTAAEVRDIFGDGVCANMANGCELTPPAKAWMDSTNAAMAGGHCYGFSVTALLFFKHVLDPSTYGASAANQLQINGNLQLQQRIAESMALQFLPAVRAGAVAGTPNDILATIRDTLKPDATESYTIGITRRDHTGGHAVTPFALMSRDNGHVAILIYDNNWPNTVREIDVDTNANTWHYQAAPNPSEPAALYEGDATTKSLFLFPTTKGVGTQPCPFCAAAPASYAAPGGGGAVLASSGHRRPSTPLGTGTTAGLFEEITSQETYDPNLTFSGAEPMGQLPLFEQTNDYASGSSGAAYDMPAGSAFTVTVHGPPTGAGTLHLDIVGAGTDVMVDGVSIQAGKTVTITVSGDLRTLTFTADDGSSPTFTVGENGNTDGSVSLTPHGLQEGDQITLDLTAQAFGIDDSKLTHPVDYGVSFTSLDHAGETTFTDHTVHVDSGVSGTVDWSRETPESPVSTLTFTWAGGSETLNNGG
jgi:hypothetical protein